MISNALAIAYKDLQVLFKDRGQLAVLFLMPVMFASIIGSVFGGDSVGIDVYLVNQDSSPYSATLVNVLHNIEALRITELESVEQADRQVADGQALAAIIIPPDLGQKIDDFDLNNKIQVIVDPTQQQYGSIVAGIMHQVLTPIIFQGEIQHGIRTVLSDILTDADPQTRRMIEAQSLGVIMTRLQQAAENPLIAVQSQGLADAERQTLQRLDSAYSYTVPSYAVMFAFFIVGAVAGAILTEKQEGTFRRLLAAPINHASLIAGKMLAYMLVVGLQVLLVFGVGSGFFHIPLGDSPLGLLLLTAALALAATSLGMLVASLARTRSQVDTVAVVLSLVLAAVGGSLTPIPETGFLHLLSQFTPHAHAIEGYLKLTSQGAGLIDVLPQVGLLSAVGLLFFVIAVRRFRFE